MSAKKKTKKTTDDVLTIPADGVSPIVEVKLPTAQAKLLAAYQAGRHLIEFAQPAPRKFSTPFSAEKHHNSVARQALAKKALKALGLSVGQAHRASNEALERIGWQICNSVIAKCDAANIPPPPAPATFARPVNKQRANTGRARNGIAHKDTKTGGITKLGDTDIIAAACTMLASAGFTVELSTVASRNPVHVLAIMRDG